MIRVQLFQSPDYRATLSFFLANTDGFHVVGSPDKSMTLDKQIHNTQADVILLDVAQEHEPDIIGRIKKYNPFVKIVVLTDEADIGIVMHALRSGANGYLLIKKTSLSTLVECIKGVHEGGFPISPFLMGDVLKMLMPQQVRTSESGLRKLTKREAEILQLLVNGFSYKGVSFHLDIALDTVRSHIRSIYDKLKVNSKSEAVVKALKENVALMM